jgi:DNA-directed RNA polymerase specialized sigma24 family protein
MKEIESETFAELLAWLDPDSDAAGEKYRQLHGRLVALFGYWRCPDPEDLADVALARTGRKVSFLRDTYKGDPWAYIRGIAWNVRREDARARLRAQSLDEHKHLPAALPEALGEAASERERACLRKCCAEVLSEDEVRLVAEYFDEPGRISGRKALARDMGISSAALRKRSERCRRKLGACLRKCLERQEVSQHSGPRPQTVEGSTHWTKPAQRQS